MKQRGGMFIAPFTSTPLSHNEIMMKISPSPFALIPGNRIEHSPFYCEKRFIAESGGSQD